MSLARTWKLGILTGKDMVPSFLMVTIKLLYMSLDENHTHVFAH